MLAGAWKEKAAEEIAKEIVSKQHFERRDFDELVEKIRKTLDEYEKEWG